MRLRNLTPMLQSSDLDRTEAWYVSRLGFARTGRAEGWLRLARDGVALMFMRNEHIGAPHATATQYIETDDLRALWVGLEADVVAEWGPCETEYGMLEVAVRDPDGYLLSFGEPVTADVGWSKGLSR